MSDVIDLDALQPDSVTIKLGEAEYKLQPPDITEVVRLGSLAGKLQKADEMQPEDLETVITSLTEVVRRCIPEIADKHLNAAQLLKLVTIINEMSTPTDIKELQKRNITVDSDPKAP